MLSIFEKHISKNPKKSEIKYTNTYKYFKGIVEISDVVF
jgi:hypothetical protein